jgi:hypothetical protein
MPAGSGGRGAVEGIGGPDDETPLERAQRLMDYMAAQQAAEEQAREAALRFAAEDEQEKQAEAAARPCRPLMSDAFAGIDDAIVVRLQEQLEARIGAGSAPLPFDEHMDETPRATEDRIAASTPPPPQPAPSPHFERPDPARPAGKASNDERRREIETGKVETERAVERKDRTAQAEKRRSEEKRRP